MAIWRIFRRSPLSEEKYPNRNPAWKQALLIIDFQGLTRKGSSTSLSGADYTNESIQLASKVNNSTGEIISLKTYTRIGGDDLKLGTEGVNVVAISTETSETEYWQRDAVNAQEANENTIIALASYDDNGNPSIIGGLKAASNSFGKINSVGLRGHSNATQEGISMVFGSDNFMEVLNGDIVFDNCATFTFMGCYTYRYAESFTKETGITSFGSNGRTGPNNNTYFNAEGNQFTKYSKIFENVVSIKSGKSLRLINYE